MILLLLWPLDVHLLNMDIPLYYIVRVFVTDIASTRIHILVSFVIITTFHKLHLHISLAALLNHQCESSECEYPAPTLHQPP